MNVTDTFNRADSAVALGTTSDGNATWSAASGTWGISSNQAYPVSSGQAVIDTGDADGSVVCTLATINSSGVVFRFQDTSNYWYVRGSSGTLRLQRVNAGSTDLNLSFGAVADGDIVTVSFVGSAITVKKNGTTVGSRTDSLLSTQTKHGLYANGTNAARMDDWSFTAAVAAPWRPPMIRARRTQAVMRAAVR